MSGVKRANNTQAPTQWDKKADVSQIFQFPSYLSKHLCKQVNCFYRLTACLHGKLPKADGKETAN